MIKANNRPDIKKLLAKHKRHYLDLGCGEVKQDQAIGMDRRNVPGVDVVHDIEDLPWPFPDGVFDGIVASHIVEHLKPWLVFDVINEAWRVMKPEGKLMIATPYAGTTGFYQDPSHVHGWVEQTPLYFDPEHSSDLWTIYKPKPWRIDILTWHHDGNLEIVLKKRPAIESNGK